jgi:hypothetical protein
VDVDPQLVATARANLKEIMQKQQVEDAFHAITQDAHTAEANATSDVPASPNSSNRTESTAPSGDSVPTGFGQDMPLSFRLWKPPAQGKEKIPKALGKAALSYVHLAGLRRVPYKRGV